MKINTSGYHPQTDGLVEKFNSTLQGMIAKSTDPNWDKRLPLLPALTVAYDISLGHRGLLDRAAHHSDEDTSVGYGEYPGSTGKETEIL